MSKVLLIRDESIQGACLQEYQLVMETEWVSVRDIIAARVLQEVEAYQQQVDSKLRLVQLRFAERLLNQTKCEEKRREIDPEKQVYIALDAFHSNSYFVLINSVQAESLDQLVQLGPQTIVSFLQLTPLVGG